MKSFALILLLVTTQLGATAPTAEDFVRGFAGMSALQRAGRALQTCKATLGKAPAQYREDIQAMGRLWSAHSEAADYLISTCNTLWTAHELDPQKSTQIGRAQKIANLDFLEAGKSALPVKIRQYMEAPGKGLTRPAPYEILNGMASSARELDLTLQQNVGLAVASLVALGGSGVVTALEATGALARTSATWGLRASATGFEPAMVVTVLSAGIAVSANYAVWWKREYDAWWYVTQILEKLEKRTPDQPLLPLLEEYYGIAERLGYFYTFSLLQADGGKDVLPEGNARCLTKLDKFFNAGNINWAVKFKRQTVCGDAAAVWMAAAQYLEQLLPQEPMAGLVADRLKARATRTYWAYKETAAFKATQPVCHPAVGVVQTSWECRDPKTGALVL
ncbi:MAG: hypothetical protein KF799_15015 [Bdellovibrionales bacterium]|nr:hypothetical protein [Bdellovibrionales bacterium]